MSVQSMEDIIREHSFFKGLQERYVKLLAGCASNVRFNAGEYIFKEGGRADKFYLIKSGKVSIEIYSPERGSIIIQTLGEGDVLGWSWLYPPYRWHFDARALELTRAIALDAECLRRKCEEDKEFGYELLKRFSQIIIQRLQSARLQLLDVYGHASRE